jgi:hypothetical protein
MAKVEVFDMLGEPIPMIPPTPILDGKAILSEGEWANREATGWFNEAGALFLRFENDQVNSKEYIPWQQETLVNKVKRWAGF